jgi:PAS domain S-box-containing protein
VQRWARWRIAIVFALLVGAYFTAAFIGRSLSHSITDVPLVWFPPGVGLAAILLVGLRRWPIVLVATFLAHWIFSRIGDSGLVLPGHSLWGVIAAADTIAAVSGAYFARKFGRADPCLSAPDFLRFAAFSAGGTGVLAATVVTIGFVATGNARSDGLPSVWLEWWLAYAVGILTMTPLILAWHRDRTIYWKWPRALELLVSIGFLAVLSYLLLVRGKDPTPSWHVALPIATILIWCAVRFGRRETAAGLFVLALVAGAAAAGPASFGGESIDESAPLVQIGLGLLSVSSLGLAVRNDDRRRSRRKLDVYRLAALQTADHWMITDVNGTVVEVNPAFEKVTGYTQSELVGKKPNVIRSGIHDKAFYENMWKTILSGEPYKGMVVNRRKNGELFYEIKSITPIRDENGRIAYFFSIGKDVTNLKQVEDELEKSATELEHMHERLALSEADLLRHIKILESVLSSSNEGVIVADRDGRFVMFSRAAKEMIGVGAISGPPSEWSASYGVFMKDGKTPFPTGELPLVRAIKGEIVNNVELFIRNPVKSEGVWLNISGRPLRDAAGNLMGGVIVARDITQDRWVKKASAELRATREELQIAERIQKRFFPRTPPTLEGGDIGGASRPAVVTGGDYYDYIQTPDGSLLLVMGDVSGHGFGPALLMASVRAYVHALAASGVEAKDIVRVVNRLLARDTNVGDFVTLLMVRVDLAARRCEYVSAGHETAYVLDSAGRVKHALKSMLPPLGVLPEIGLREMSTFEIDPGDLLLMVTDGIMEAENTDGEPFGEERLVEAVRCNHHHRASEIVTILHKAVANYCGGKVQDDITSIVLKYDPKT